MTSGVLPDPSSPFGERVQRRLRDELVIWLTTVGDDGTPQPNPVWFLWDGDTFLVYNRATAHRVAHVRERPLVSLHLNSSDRGSDIVVVTGRAELAGGDPAAHELPAYVAKYGPHMTRVSGSPEAFARAYPVPMRIRPQRVRGF